MTKKKIISLRAQFLAAELLLPSFDIKFQDQETRQIRPQILVLKHGNIVFLKNSKKFWSFLKAREKN